MTTESLHLGFSRGRFAPSTTGRAHPGTLLAALLCWLDARRAGAEITLRLEDLDRERTKPGYVDQMAQDLAWFGFDWNTIERQSEQRARHESYLESLVREGRVYACECSRSKIRASGRRAPDGSHAYPGTCRARRVETATWREEPRPLRVELDSAMIELEDEGGADLSGNAVELFGDPIIRRRDGAFAYHFVSVIDDAESGVDRVVRGRDLAPSTLLQVALQRLLGIDPPTYRHHCLFLERRGEKLSKLHGAVDIARLRDRHSAPQLCGRIAEFVGINPSGEACLPKDLIPEFDWSRVSRADIELGFDEDRGLCRAEEHME